VIFAHRWLDACTCQAFPKRLRLRTAYSALSPPLRKLNRNIVLSSPASSGIGDIGCDDGSEFTGGATKWGRADPQISHSVSAGWFKKVHAGHATSLGGLPGAVGGKEEGRYVDEGGAETARGGVVAIERVFARGTPQSTHFAAVGLEPGGLRKSHTSHRQLSRDSPPSTAGPSGVKYIVTFGDDLKSPA
jgi:hypothetical protein